MQKKNVVLFLGSVCVSLVIFEFGLRAFTVFPIHPPLANRVYDDRLGYRMKRFSGEIDQNGFRNRKILANAQIVAVGDSHTFGYNVSIDEAWPQQLARMTNESVYNLGVGGYGSLQYYYLIDGAIRLHPRHIVLGLYIANDLDDTCKLISQLEYWQKWAEDRGFNIEACRNSEKSDPPGNKVGVGARPLGVWWAIEAMLLKTAIGSLVQYYSMGLLAEMPSPDDTVIVNEKVNKTIIRHARIAAHKRYTDLTREHIAFGFQISKRVLLEAKRLADDNGIKFSVVFIPSKENVFFDYLIEKGYKLPQDYYALISNERDLLEKFSVFLGEINVRSVDARPYILQELYKSGNVYLGSDDGHPTKIGYEAYAKAVYGILLQ